MELATFANNVYLLERLDYFCNIPIMVSKHAPQLLILVYIIVVRSFVANLYAVVIALVLFFEMCPFFGWKEGRGVRPFTIIVQGAGTLVMYKIALLLLTLINIGKSIIFIIYFLSNDPNTPLLGLITNLEGHTQDKNLILKEGGYTLAMECGLTALFAFNVKRYRPIVLHMKDVIFYRKRMDFWMNFISPCFEIIVFLHVALERTFFGFMIAFFACLVSFCQIPSFDKHYSFKILTFAVFNLMCWLVFIFSLYFSTPIDNESFFNYFKNNLNLEDELTRKNIGAFMPYRLMPAYNIIIFDSTKADLHSWFVVSKCFFAIMSGLLMYHLKLGSLSQSKFALSIAKESHHPPESIFKDTNNPLQDDIKSSYYINFFIKKIALIFRVDIRKALDEKDNLTVNYIKLIPYVDVPALIKKIKLFIKFKKKNEIETEQIAKRVAKRTFDFMLETLKNIFTISNIVYSFLFTYVAFFFYFKNQNPSLFSFLPFVGIFLLGVCKFKTFIFYSQFLVGIPMIVNFMLFYLANMPLDIAKCEGKSSDVGFMCRPYFGIIRRMWTVPLPGKTNPTETTMFLEMLVKIGLFQGIFFFYRMLKFSGELFVEKSNEELNLEIEESLNRGSLPLIKILIIQIASKFYLICFILMLYIGTSHTTYTNMVLLLVAIIYMSKYKLIGKWWILVYIIMNIIFLSAYFIDLFIFEDEKIGGVLSFLNLLGLPTNKAHNSKSSQEGQTGTGQGGGGESTRDPNNAFSEDEFTNKMFVMILYICCLIQQIAGRNAYIKCYLIKLNKIKNSDNWVEQNISTWKMKLKMFVVKFYYKMGVWLSYFFNLYLPLFQSLSICRAALILALITAFLIHINALKKVKTTKESRIFLDSTYNCWRVFLVLKVINLCLIIVGEFGLNSIVREKLGIVRDSEDYETINFIGIENLDKEIIAIIPTLQNCSNTWAADNKLRFYFVTECITFIMTKIAMKIINIQRIYHNNLYGFPMSKEKISWLRTTKPKLYRVHKIYFKYIVGSSLIKNRKADTIVNGLSSFLARVYTSVIYFVTLAVSIFRNISLLMFFYLYFCLNYFIKMNKIFLSYLTTEKVEKVVEFSKIRLLQNLKISTRNT